jgi:hypothetical protein
VAEPIDFVDITVAGDPTLARDTAAGALAARGFTMVWTDTWTGVATKGSKGKQAIFGSFAQYLEIGISVYAANSGAENAASATIVHLTRPSTGMSGGLAGRAKARKNFATLSTELGEVFRANGVFIGATAPTN